MRRTVASLLLALAVTPAPLARSNSVAPPAPPAQRLAAAAGQGGPSGLVPTIKPRVEIVFALDTTGSMGGLIDGAKRKIWAIANEVARAEQRPAVKIGLVAYRDRGDAYVTQVTPLTDNLDAVYEGLMALRADGGGDTPEDVNAALTDAVSKMAWSDDKGVLKMVFLVGDAPAHVDYPGQPQWSTTAQAAVHKRIYINTVQCGGDPATTTLWKSIAHAAEGRFAAIPQDGGVVAAVATPYDVELASLARELDATNFTYGRAAEREAKVASRRRAGVYAAAAPAAAAADRAVAKATLGAGMKADEDLVTLAEASGSAAAALSRVASDELPAELRGRTKAEQEQILEDNRAKRAALSKKIAALSKQRDEHLATAAKKAPAQKDSFDAEVGAMIRAEGSRTGLSW
ncbi:MAG: VWA domain-containing protein [Deltaproteobacteria bacterium]|nr:VWA domain-containing protein [Deltaproteobacteria bacterium]